MTYKEAANNRINGVIELVKRIKKTGHCSATTLKEIETDLHQIFNYGYYVGWDDAKEDSEIENQETL